MTYLMTFDCIKEVLQKSLQPSACLCASERVRTQAQPNCPLGIPEHMHILMDQPLKGLSMLDMELLYATQMEKKKKY